MSEFTERKRHDSPYEKKNIIPRLPLGKLTTLSRRNDSLKTLRRRDESPIRKYYDTSRTEKFSNDSPKTVRRRESPKASNRGGKSKKNHKKPKRKSMRRYH